MNLVADLAGTFLPGTPTVPGTFQPIVPTRVLDSRFGIGTPINPVPANGSVNLQVGGTALIPANAADTVIANVTVTNPTLNGYISVFPNGANPRTSNLNFAPGQTVPNLVYSLLGNKEQVVFRSTSGGSVQLIADVAGYYLWNNPATAATATSPRVGAPLLRPTPPRSTRPALSKKG